MRRHALIALVLAVAPLAACGKAEPVDADLQAKQEAAARDADKVPVPPEQEKATSEQLKKDLDAWK